MSPGPVGSIHGGPTQMPHQESHVEAMTHAMSMKGQKIHRLAHAYNSIHVYQHLRYCMIEGELHC
jgi:hypothetical protein